MTLRTCDSSVPTSVAICETGIRVAEAHTISARSRLASDAALRDSRLSRLPSSGNNSRTNTDGGRIQTSRSGMRPSSTSITGSRSINTRRSTSATRCRPGHHVPQTRTLAGTAEQTKRPLRSRLLIGLGSSESLATLGAVIASIIAQPRALFFRRRIVTPLLMSTRYTIRVAPLGIPGVDDALVAGSVPVTRCASAGAWTHSAHAGAYVGAVVDRRITHASPRSCRRGHSHGLVRESIKRSREGLRAVALAPLVLAATAIAQTVVFVASDSVALLADLIHNFGDAATAIPLAIAFALRSARAERVAGLAVVLAIFVSACVAGYRRSTG